MVEGDFKNVYLEGDAELLTEGELTV